MKLNTNIPEAKKKMFDLEIGKIKMDMDRADKLEIKENIEKDIPVPVEVEKSGR